MISHALEGWTDEEREALRVQLARLVETLMTQSRRRVTTAGDLRMTPDSHGYLSHKQILVVMGGLMAGMFLAALDQSIVGTALPRITSELGGLDKLSWVVTAYMLTATASTPLWGKISDLYGRRLLFQIAIVTFLVGSLLAGFSQNIEQLIALPRHPGPRRRWPDVAGARHDRRHHPAARARSLPGLLRRGLRYVVRARPGARRLLRRRPRLAVDLLHQRPDRPGRAGGHLGRAEDAARAPRALDRLPRRRSRGRLGVARSCSTPPGPDPDLGWGSTTGVAPARRPVSLLAVAFVLVELRASEPIIPMRLFGNSIFAIANLFGFLIGIAMFGSMIFIPVYLQVVDGHEPDPVRAWRCCRWWSASSRTSILAGQLMSRTGRYKIFPILGAAIVIVALLMLSSSPRPRRTGSRGCRCTSSAPASASPCRC